MMTVKYLRHVEFSSIDVKITFHTILHFEFNVKFLTLKISNIAMLSNRQTFLISGMDSSGRYNVCRNYDSEVMHLMRSVL